MVEGHALAPEGRGREGTIARRSDGPGRSRTARRSAGDGGDPPAAGARRAGRAGAGTCDGAALLEALGGGAAFLADHVEEVDALNVFPVPDGDTGSNMLATLRAALAAADGVRARGRGRAALATAIADGALMGARGNSGVILSQIIRGMAEVLGQARAVTGREVARAFEAGSRSAEAALSEPVEGTLLTVIRDVAVATAAAADEGGDADVVLRAAVDEAARSVARTTTLLPVLREAGVVDAGGQGLLRILEGALASRSTPRGAVALEHRVAEPRSASLEQPAEGFGYETEFLLTAGARPLDPAAIRAHLAAIASSVLVAGDPGAVKVHVHSPRPDQVIAYGLSLGTLTRVSIENLDAGAREASARRRGEATPPAPRPAAGAGTSVVAVAAGPGLARVFESLGCDATVAGGRGRRPSAGQLVEAIRSAPGADVVLLPNDPDTALAARQAAALCREKRVTVVPTRNAPEGVAALLALGPAREGHRDPEALLEAARAVACLEVTDAARAATVDGRDVRPGQAVAQDPAGRLVGLGDDAASAVLDALAGLPPCELLTIYHGRAVEATAAHALARAIASALPDLEVEVVDGGQAQPSYLLALE